MLIAAHHLHDDIDDVETGGVRKLAKLFTRDHHIILCVTLGLQDENGTLFLRASGDGALPRQQAFVMQKLIGQRQARERRPIEILCADHPGIGEHTVYRLEHGDRCAQLALRTGDGDHGVVAQIFQRADVRLRKMGRRTGMRMHTAHAGITILPAALGKRQHRRLVGLADGNHQHLPAAVNKNRNLAANLLRDRQHGLRQFPRHDIAARHRNVAQRMQIVTLAPAQAVDLTKQFFHERRLLSS